MNTKIKILIVGVVTLLGIFGSTNTISAQNVVQHCDRATLNGWVDPNGNPTIAWFEWGEGSSNFNHITPTNTYYSYQNYTYEITGLTGDTLYSFRTKFRNNVQGEWSGETKSFKTPPCAPTVLKPTVTLMADNSNINHGSSTILRWTTTNNPTSCTASGDWYGSKNLSGGNEPTGNLYSNKTYSITCSNSAGSSNDSVTITVGSAPITTYTVSTNAGQGGYISPPSRTVNSGQTATFKVTPNSGYTINSVTGSSCSINPIGNNEYVTGAIYSNCTVTATFSIVPIVVPDPIVTLTANPTQINSGQPVTLSWTSQNTSYCSAPWTYSTVTNNYTGVTLYPTTTKTYNITCYNTNGKSASSSTIVMVNDVRQKENPTVTLLVDGKSSTTITAGQPATLSWNTNSAASYCSANWMTGSGTTGSQPVYPTYQTTYNITCYGSTGTTPATASVIVYVTAKLEMTGTLNGNSSCIIPLNGNGCNTTITWDTTNPKGISSITSSYPYEGSTIANRNSGSQSVFIPFSSRNFYLYNSGELLDTKIITSSCVQNTQWDGTKCSTTVVPVQYPTVTLTADNTNLSYGGSTSIRWSPNNATSCVASNGSNGWSGTKSIYADSFYTGVLNTTTTYNIVCTNSAGSDSKSVTVYVGQPVNQTPTVTLTADNTNVNYGNTTTLRWNSNNATSCTATSNNSNYWYGNVNLSGSWNTGILTTPTTYTITCSGANNTSPAVSSVTVYVNNNNNRDCSYYNNCNNYTQAPVINLSANSTYITSGSGAYLTWNPTNNPTYCTASNGGNNWAGTKSTYSSNFSTGALYYTTVYTMTCGNSAGSTTESVVININNQNNNISQPNVTLTADSTSVIYGGNTTIRWYPVNATSCYANSGSNGWAGTKSTYSNSFYTGALTNTTTYNITCSNNNGNADTKSVTVYVGNQREQTGNDPYVSLNADEETLSYNGATYLRWTSQNATSCIASGGSTGWSGTKSIGPASFYTGSLTSGKTYKITCSNSYGYASDTVTIGVRGQTINNPRPAPTSLVLITSSVDRNQPIVPTIDNTRPKPGDEINYTVNYQNIGTGSITKLNLRMDLPYEVDYIFSNPNNPTRSGSTLLFNLGTLGANKEGTVTVRVRVRENIPAGTNLNFPAMLSYTDPSGYPQSVSANVSAQVWSQPVITEQPINTTITEPIQLGALAFLFGNGFLPNNLIGWLLLILLIVLLVLAARKAYSNYTREVVFVADNSKTEHH